MTRAVSQEDFVEIVGGADEMPDYIDLLQDSGSLQELFETGSCTVKTSMGMLELCLTVSRTD